MSYTACLKKFILPCDG